MNSLSIHIVMIIIVSMLYQHQVYGSACPSSGIRHIGHGNVGYWALDSVKPYGIESCDRLRTQKIDYTPPKTNDKFTWKNWLGLAGSVVSVFAPIAGGQYVAFANFYNNIAFSTAINGGIGGQTAAEFANLADAMNKAIENKVNTLKKCIENEILKEFSDSYARQVSGFITDLNIIYTALEEDEITIQNVQEGLDDVWTRMTNHADKYSKAKIGNDYKGLKYEILAPSFDFFIHIFSEYAKLYLAIKQAYCNDIEYQPIVH